ncbi:hypothetical protein VARIO8X_80013 [Burkholderiales bacterium 8X]|nr:hypothetical protein VARIO8X_80013 [Burkholderiales bacterium 8X]
MAERHRHPDRHRGRRPRAARAEGRQRHRVHRQGARHRLGLRRPERQFRLAQLAARCPARSQLAVRRQQHLVRRLRLSHHAELAGACLARHQLRRAVVQPVVLPELRQSEPAAGRGPQHRRRRDLGPRRPQRQAGALRQQDPRLHHQHHPPRERAAGTHRRLDPRLRRTGRRGGRACQRRFARPAQRTDRQAAAAPRTQHGVARNRLCGRPLEVRRLGAARGTPLRRCVELASPRQLHDRRPLCAVPDRQGLVAAGADRESQRCRLRNRLWLQPARPHRLPHAALAAEVGARGRRPGRCGSGGAALPSWARSPSPAGCGSPAIRSRSRTHRSSSPTIAASR